MRLLKELPEIEEKIQEGKLSLTVLAQAQSFFRKEKSEFKSPEKKLEVIEALEDKSALEAQRELLKRTAQPEQHIQEKTRRVSESHTEVKFVAENALLEMIEELRGLLAHSHPEMTIRDAVEYSVGLALEKHRPKKPSERDFEKAQAHSERRSEVRSEKGQEKEPVTRSSPSDPLPPEEVEIPPEVLLDSAYIPAPNRRIVWHRDGGSCTFVDTKTGRRCCSTYRIQFDHKWPRALGGETTVENLRLLCFHHNQWMAEQIFGQRAERAYA